MGRGAFPRQLPWVGFGLSLVVLVLIAVATDHFTKRLENDEQWVSRSQDVERLLGRLRGDLLAAETGRLLYVVTGSETRLDPYDDSSERIPGDIAQLKSLTTDNPVQQKRLDDLRGVINRRAGTLNELIALRKAGGEEAREEADISLVASVSNQAMTIVQQMRDDEDTLLKKRQIISAQTYDRVRHILGVAFVAVVVVLALTFRRLWVALRERVQAEGSVRRLNGRILQLQDTERRKVARELHDSIGQVFAAMKMNLALISGKAGTLEPEKKTAVFSDLQTLIEIGVTETRTLSHLLHPPLLDELGFASAARWLIDGFSQRSNIKVSLDIAPQLQRMPQEVELVLFRVLQESLTNIHRHSGSSTAAVGVDRRGSNVNLSVRDYGTGISSEILEHFKTTSAGLGVGLAGMRERVSELGGSMEIYSDLEGTRLNVSLPTTEITADVPAT